jgi:hypothetical protein
MIMAGKWMVFDDDASASSSSIWMIGMVDSVVGDSKMASVRKVSLRNEHDVYVAQRKEGFQFFCVLMKAVGVPEHKLKECRHYLSLVRTVVRRFINGSHLLKKTFHKSFEVRGVIELLKGKVGEWCRCKGWRRRKIF